MPKDPLPELHYVTIKDGTFKDQLVVLDNHQYESCTFEHCKILWSGGPTKLIEDKFDNCFFEYTGFAATVLDTFKKMPHGK